MKCFIELSVKQIYLLEKIAELKQKEIDEKISVLKAAEMIGSSIDDVDKITIINQLCKLFLNKILYIIQVVLFCLGRRGDNKSFVKTAEVGFLYFRMNEVMEKSPAWR